MKRKGNVTKSKIFIVSFIMALVNGCFNLYDLKQFMVCFPNIEVSFNDFYVKTLGYLDIYSIKHVYPVIIWIFPIIILGYFLSDYMIFDIKTRGSIIFTRTEKRGQWFLHRTLDISGYIALFYIIYSITEVAIGRIFIEKVDLFFVFSLTLLNFLFAFGTIFLVNVMSLFINSQYAFWGLLTLYMMNVLHAGFIVESPDMNLNIIRYMPAASGIFIWHESKLLKAGGMFENTIYLEGFLLQESIIALIILVVLTYILGRFKIVKKDIL